MNTTTLLRKCSIKAAIIILLCGLGSSESKAQPLVVLTPVISTGLNQPIQFVNAGDGSKRIFIVQKEGTIRVYDSVFNYISDFVTVSGVNTVGERGLLSMAFHPAYATNGLFYVYYTNTAGNLELARYHVSTTNANLADTTTRVTLITIPHPTNSNHNGGELHFGADGFLYLSTGDGGGAGDVPNNAQSTTVLLGKILRFAVNTTNTSPYYTIPPGNPYANEIYDLGLRNPYRWSFDRITNDMWIGDVGQDSWEEINYRPASTNGNVNFGWHCYEGNVTYNTTACAAASAYVFPVHTYPTQNPSASITGGVVYRGNAYPVLQGWYLSADFYSGIFYKIHPDGSGGWTVSTQTVATTGIVNFGESESGEVYAVSLTGNSVSNISSNTVLPLSLVSFTAVPISQGVELNWKTAKEENLRHFEIEYSMDGNAYSFLATVTAKNALGTSDYSFNHNIAYDGSIFYRLKMIDTDGRFTYSGVAEVHLKNGEEVTITPNIINDGILRIKLKEHHTYQTLKIISMDGKVVLKKYISENISTLIQDLHLLNSGMYLVRLEGNNPSYIQKIIIQ